MDQQRRMHGVAAVLTWLPVALLLSASSCETDQERRDREFREMMDLQMLQQRWNAEFMQKLQDDRVKAGLPPINLQSGDPHTGKNPDDRTKPQEAKREERP
jgi:hypothetical protein